MTEFCVLFPADAEIPETTIVSFAFRFEVAAACDFPIDPVTLDVSGVVDLMYCEPN